MSVTNHQSLELGIECADQSSLTKAVELMDSILDIEEPRLSDTKASF